MLRSRNGAKRPLAAPDGPACTRCLSPNPCRAFGCVLTIAASHPGAQRFCHPVHFASIPLRLSNFRDFQLLRVKQEVIPPLPGAAPSPSIDVGVEAKIRHHTWVWRTVCFLEQKLGGNRDLATRLGGLEAQNICVKCCPSDPGCDISIWHHSCLKIRLGKS